MIDNQNSGFGKFVPGFDFLQNLAKGASQALPQMPNLSNWVAPTLNVEELDKRISELKAVHFWLDQNSKALGATIQALEVQKMTLATLRGMNFSMGDVANALRLKAADSVMGGVQMVSDKVEEAAAAVSPATETKKEPESKPAAREPAKDAAPLAGGLIDPLQWWGALTQQFQQIASTALKDAATQTTGDAAKGTTAGAAKAAPRTAAKAAKPAAAKRPARKKAARKP